MKTIMKSLLALIVAVTSLTLSGCNPKSDPETEQKIEGSWETYMYETETEDGVTMRFKVTENVTYQLPSHRMHGTVNMRMVSPMSINFLTMSFEGTWCADKQSLTENYDKKSIKFEFHTDLIDREDKEEMKRDMMSEFESKAASEIRMLDSDMMMLWDGEDEITYKRN